MKTILFLALCALGGGCGSKKTDASACSDAITKGVDTMMAAGAKRMEAMGIAPDMKAKMDDAAVKLKQVIINRCTEDKWPADIIACYGGAATREDIKACRAKLPQDQAAKLQTEELQVMSTMMGGVGRGMKHPGGDSGAGAPATPAAPDGTPPSK